MVEPMKRVVLLMADFDADEVLDGLQDLGVIHISAEPASDDAGIPELDAKITRLRRSSAALVEHVEEGNPADDPLYGKYLVELPEEAYVLDTAVREFLADIDRHQAEADRCRSELEAWAPWGGLDLRILAALEDAGLHLDFYTATRKEYEAAVLPDRPVEIINDEGGRLFLVDLRYPGDPADAAELPFTSVRLPGSGVETLRSALKTNDEAVARLKARLSLLEGRRYLIEAELERLERDRERRLAALSLDSGDRTGITWLEGYVPVSLLEKLQEFLEEHHAVPWISDPEPRELPPVRLKNRPAARLFEPITKIFGLPDYAEIDTTPFFAPFFAFFFGMCLADVGYGVLVTLGSLLGLVVLRKPSARSLAVLGVILGFTTVLGGLFVNTLFGMKIDGLPSLPPSWQALLLFRDIDDAMAFSLLLGVAQILLGFAMQVANRWRQEGFAAALQPAGTLLLIIAAGFWALEALGAGWRVGPIPVGALVAGFDDPKRVAMVLGIAGIVLILLFNNPTKKLWMRPLLGLWEMYGIASGVPGDILSYIRLFALSLAGGLLGGAINHIAGMIRGDDPGLLAWFFALVVLVGGHAINFALAALGAFVHPLRLTFVEFYKAVGFRGGGTAYAPYGGQTS